MKLIARIVDGGRVVLTWPNYAAAQAALIDTGMAWTPLMEAAVLDHAVQAEGLAPGEYTLVEADTVPASRVFRDAWRLDGDALAVDMAAARDIQRDRWREARAPLLAALDVAYQRADETDDAAAKADIVAAKNALRDVTDTDLSGAATPEELAAVWPECLGAMP